MPSDALSLQKSQCKQHLQKLFLLHHTSKPVINRRYSMDYLNVLPTTTKANIIKYFLYKRKFIPISHYSNNTDLRYATEILSLYLKC